VGWLAVVERVAEASRRVRPNDRRLVRAVAENLYKLTAYKDEYEVARLMLDADGTAAARELAAGRARIAWKLHPPLLRALGMRRKLSIGMGAAPLIRLLAAARLMRGTIFDPFRFARVRRVERVLAAEYVAALDRGLEYLDAARFDALVELAGLPDGVRGYEELKLERVAEFRAALAAAEAELAGSSSRAR
jgi:indolepyruvate ferredoxin oxidoreductase